MQEQFVRTEAMLGTAGMERLRQARVAVFGIGGVGGHVAEALARSGVGAIDLIDKDVVSVSNINRQMVATLDTIGRYKTEVMQERIMAVNPECLVTVHNVFYLPDTKDIFDFSKYTYVVDAVDTVTAKLSIIEECKKHKVQVISCMGAGNKLDATRFEVADIHKTSVCPLAKVMRRELKKRGIEGVKAVYSKEEPAELKQTGGSEEISVGSVAFVPSVAGLIIAGEVIKDIAFSQNV